MNAALKWEMLRRNYEKAQKKKTHIEEYRKSRKEYKYLCRRKKEDHWKSWLEELKQIKKKKKWKYIKRFKGRKDKLPQSIPIEILREYFLELLQELEERKVKTIYVEREGIEELTDDKIVKQIQALKKGKALGEDDIGHKLKELIKSVWRGEGFPEAWRMGNIQPIWKKGSNEKIENYRGISLLSTAYKNINDH